MISVYSCAALCLFSLVVWPVLHFAAIRISGRNRAASSNTVDAARSESDVGPQVRALVDAIEKLTDRMDAQVVRHSSRVGEITGSIQSAQTESSLMLYAGSMLIEANQKLQSELQEAKAEITRQRTQMREILQESLTDPLTDIPNRRAWDRELARLFTHWNEEHRSFSVLMLDIDHFKRVNDVYGHMVGDQLLKGFARQLREAFCDNAFIARLGGEEFAVALSGMPLSSAVQVAERFRQTVELHQYAFGNQSLKITVSMGIKQVRTAVVFAEVMSRVDQALYAAKSNGRNQCYVYGDKCCRPAPLMDRSQIAI